jgi:hypothetical protein
MAINWKFPTPRNGIAGALDRFIGPGATRAEKGMQLIFPVLAATAAPIYGSHAAPDWSLVQYIVCALIAFDVMGGVVTNSTSSAKRWYHRAGQGFRQHVGFVSLHLLYLLLVSWLYLSLDLTWILVAGVYLLCAACLILSVPLYLQRPTAFVSYVFAFLISTYLLRQPRGLEWFLPLFYLKLLVSHLPTEEPYRPYESG